MPDSSAVADEKPVAVSAPAAQSRAITTTAPSGLPATAPGAGVPGGPRPAGGAPAEMAQPKRSGRLRRFLLPVIVLAAVGYAGKFAYDYYVEGRFLVSTDDAYVGANTAIIAAKASGHLMQVPVVDNQTVRRGDLIALIDDGDYRIAVDDAQAKVGTQDATIARFGRQIEAQAAVIAQAGAQVDASQAQERSAEAEVQRAALEYDRSYKLAQTNFGSQQRLEQAAADRDRTVAALAAARANAASAVAALAGAKANLDVLKAQRDEASRQRDELMTALAKAKRDLGFTRVVAPFDGVVGNKAAEVGNLVAPGTRLMALVPLAASYVDANTRRPSLAGSSRDRRPTSPSTRSTARRSRASSRRSRRPPGRSSRCCRPTTRPAISPRSFSGSRCASPSPRTF